ncbi:TPA: hypothetical protein IVC08_23355 [Escherichia coli]|nr:hypothetical protein [Escherichia coli]EEV9926800.1 hypothetical protein [Escherichia coli]EEW1034569.1 hypothetical protein [Escherichia coli]EEX2777838.1 hypothetical protein [Escherichia coli]EEY2315785.1 hypothetical protein [Escherichia coli]
MVFMPEADSLKHPQQFYLTLPLQQTVFARYGNSHIGMNSVHLARLSVQFFPFCELPLHAAGAASGKRIHVLKDVDGCQVPFLVQPYFLNAGAASSVCSHSANRRVSSFAS